MKESDQVMVENTHHAIEDQDQLMVFAPHHKILENILPKIIALLTDPAMSVPEI